MGKNKTKKKVRKASKKTKKKSPDNFLIRSPLEEYISYVEGKIEESLRVGDPEKAELYQEALELGKKMLK